MLSYREKRLLAVQKYLIDESTNFGQDISDIEESFNSRTLSNYKAPERPQFSTFDELADYAMMQNYDLFIRVEDILNPEELEQLDREYKDIEKEFAKITGLKKADCAFIVVATALQVIRQYVQPKLTKEVTDQSERGNDKETAKEYKKDYQDKMDKKGEKAKEDDNSKGARYYHASNEDITNIKKSVPYDAIKGTKKFGLNFSGNNHRFKTLGHDPLLGYLFGTCNILTNTMSTGKDNMFRTLHIRDSKVVAEANMIMMLERSVERFKESKKMVAVALLKQFIHIKSDELSKKGIAIPGLELFLDSDTIEKITGKLDYAMLRTVGDQIALAAMINLIISISHQLYLWIEEQNPNVEKNESKYSDLINPSDVKKIRTKKVIMISNTIATTSNILVTGIAAGVGASTGNAKAVDFARENFDLGGLIVTILTLFKDVRFITKIKKEFIEKALDREFNEKLQALNDTTELDLLDSYWFGSEENPQEA